MFDDEANVKIFDDVHNEMSYDAIRCIKRENYRSGSLPILWNYFTTFNKMHKHLQ